MKRSERTKQIRNLDEFSGDNQSSGLSEACYIYIYTYHFKDLCKHLEVKADPKTWRQVKVVLHSYVGVALSVFIKGVCMIFSHIIDQ